MLSADANQWLCCLQILRSLKGGRFLTSGVHPPKALGDAARLPLGMGDIILHSGLVKMGALMDTSDVFPQTWNKAQIKLIHSDRREAPAVVTRRWWTVKLLHGIHPTGSGRCKVDGFASEPAREQINRRRGVHDSGNKRYTRRAGQAGWREARTGVGKTGLKAGMATSTGAGVSSTSR